MQIAQIVNFNDWYLTVKDTSMNVQLAYKLRKLNKQYADDIEFYQTKIQELFSECIATDEDGQFQFTEDGQFYLLQPDKEDIFNEKYGSIATIEVEEPSILLTLEDLNELAISPSLLEALEPFIEE